MLTVKQAASKLRIAAPTLYHWIEKGIVNATRHGDIYIIMEEDLKDVERPALGRKPGAQRTTQTLGDKQSRLARAHVALSAPTKRIESQQQQAKKHDWELTTDNFDD